MRTVFLRNVEYEAFAKIMDAIMETVPFAIINQYYSGRLKACFINFWDSDYIPEEMIPYVIQPPVSREVKDLMREKLMEAVPEGASYGFFRT